MNLEKLKGHKIPSIDHDYTAKDVILYALGLGYGTDPLDEDELKYVFEDGLQAVPSLCNTLSHPGFWIRDPALEVDWVRLLHGEQSFVIHKPLPAEGKVQGRYRIVSIEDKGLDKGAMMYLEKILVDRETDEPYCTVTQTIFMRGDGGQGGFGEAAISPTKLPDREADIIIKTPILPQAALIYRLSGDMNPLHVSPKIAQAAGFDRPILQGLCTMGIATRALLEAVCDNEPARMKSMFVRFSSPVFPGETIRTELFREDNIIRFRCFSVERDLLVLDRGTTALI